MIAIGVGIGVALIVLDGILERAGARFRAHVMPVAVGIYLPLSIAVPIFMGGLIHHLFGRRVAGAIESRDSGVLFGSGLIAGEALMGILLAIPIVLNHELPAGPSYWAASLGAFGLLAAGYAFVARRRAE